MQVENDELREEVDKLQRLAKGSFEQGWEEAKVYYFGTIGPMEEQVNELTSVSAFPGQVVPSDLDPRKRHAILLRQQPVAFGQQHQPTASIMQQ